MSRGLVIGMGEVGYAMAAVMGKAHDIECLDKEDPHYEIEQGMEVMHICFPWSTGFEHEVRRYQILYSPRHTVIHSTVPIGTSNNLWALHSPVVGMHPGLKESLMAFTRFIGGPGCDQVAHYFRAAGLKVYLFDEAETAELLKLYSTLFYSVSIELTKEVRRRCRRDFLPFEAWTIWTEDYNRGYQELGRPEVTRPNLVPILTNLGGHCLSSNLDLVDSPFARLVKELQEK